MELQSKIGLMLGMACVPALAWIILWLANLGDRLTPLSCLILSVVCAACAVVPIRSIFVRRRFRWPILGILFLLLNLYISVSFLITAALKQSHVH